MTEILIKPDCGNAPRKKLLEDFNIAFATGDADFIIQNVSTDIQWTIFGDKVITGKEAAVNGEITMAGKVYVSCKMKSYVIKIREEN